MLSDRQIETISGLCAGFSTTVVTHPLDLIKIRLQLSPEKSQYPFQQLRNVVSGIHKAAVAEQAAASTTAGAKIRPRSFYILHQYYRGIAPNLIGNISAWSVYFTLYAEFKANVVKTQSTTLNYFASSTLAGVLTTLLTNPVWVLKTRILGSNRADANAYKSVVDGVRQILVKEGPLAFWKGTVPSLFSVLQGSLQFTFYDLLKNYHTRPKLDASAHLISSETAASSHNNLSTGQYIYISGVSRMLAMIIMYPSSTVKARLQNYQGEARPIAKVCSDIWTKEGKWRGFYKGVGANMVRAIPATCVTFVAYESVKNQLKRYQ